MAQPASEPAAAVPPPLDASALEQAKQLSDEGMRLYRGGAYAQAIAAFSASYALSRNDALLFNLGQASRLDGRCRDAVAYYRRYLDAPGDAPYRSVAEERLRETERCAQAGT